MPTDDQRAVSTGDQRSTSTGDQRSTSTGDQRPTSTGDQRPTSTDDLVEIQQLLARYAVTITQGDIDGLIAVFAPDGTYSAFGDVFGLDAFPKMVAAAPKGLFLTGTPVVDLAGDTATGTQPLCFIEHASHDMRIGYYNDTYVRTAEGWRLRTRAMTFIRRSGVHDSGRPHAYEPADS